MTDHLTDDELRRARKIAEAQFAGLPHRDEDWEIAARAILAHVPDPGPAKLTAWSEELRWTWAEYLDGPALILGNADDQIWILWRETMVLTSPSDLTPRPDLAPVDLTPRPIDQEPETTPRTVTTEHEYEALPEGSIVAHDGQRPFYLLEDMWCDLTGYGPFTHTRMAGTTRIVLREGWGA